MEIPCAKCGKILNRKPSWIAKNKRNFCSKECATWGQTDNPLIIGKKCDFCKKVITNKKPNELAKHKYSFCSRFCYEKFKIVKKQYFPCEVCGKQIYLVPKHASRVKHHFCSKKCNGIFVRKFRVCLNCKKPHRHKSNWKFCSRKCYGDYTHETNYRKNIFEQPCPYCGKTLKVWKCFVGKLKFCGRKCADRYHSKRMTGNGNSNFIHGNSSYPYPLIWNKVFREMIRKRDGEICQLCGVPQSFLLRKLHVHHIDWNKDHTYSLNLISLCHPCHRKCHRKKERSEKLLLKLLSEKALVLSQSLTSESKITTITS